MLFIIIFRMNFEGDHEGPIIDRYKESILYLLERHRILIVVGETGSGKSTRIPQILFSAGVYNDCRDKETNQNRLICITQPRRVAAMQLAQRVSQDLNCNLGSTVGYAVRFKDVTDADQTMIKFMTEGLLLRELMADPLLTRYSVIMVDEVHERNLNTDILLALLKCLMIRRDDLRLIVCSATLNIDEIYNFFIYTDDIVSQNEELKKPAILSCHGKSYPIKIYYRDEPVANYLEATIETAINIHEANRLASGKILIFLTGQDEVEFVCERLNDYAQTSESRLDLKKLFVLPLHASLKPEEISKVFDEHGRDRRVCIVSTNVAETSLTIQDVAFVIDCGFSKLKVYGHNIGIESLVRLPISKSSAKQRAGRAGRTRSGIVYRLYSENEYNNLAENTIPEIQRSSLTETVMLLKSLGIDNPQAFQLISPMPTRNLVAAFELLYALQAIDESGQLTSCGEIMAQFNLDPKISKILVSLETSTCTLEACKIAAMLQVKEIFIKPGRHANSLWSNENLKNFCVSEGDLLSYLNIFNGFLNSQMSKKWADRRCLNYQALLNATEISSKLERQLKQNGIKVTSSNVRLETIQKSLVSGLFPNAAYLHPSGDYKTIKGDQLVYLHPTSIYSEILERPKFVVFVEILNTTKTYMRHLMSIEPNWLLDVAPHFYTFGTNLEVMRNKSL